MAKKLKESRNMKEYMPWIEKYRPRKIDDIAHQAHVIDTLRNALKTSDLPHLLFYGPPGTGKTSTILALCRQLYGPNLMKSRVLELNASDERGINVVRTKIKTFAQYTVSSSDKESGYPCPPYKIIILDESDSMTRDSQTALRRTMERYHKVTRFCLICNYVSRIIAPVASRCAKFRFDSLTPQSMQLKLTEIAQYEGVKIADKTLKQLVSLSDGDMRKSITLLQSAALMRPITEEITEEDVSSVSVRVPQTVIDDRLMVACLSKQFSNINNAANYVVAEGYPVELVFGQLLESVIRSNDFTNLGKAKISIQIAESDRKLVDGASEFLQLLHILGTIAKNIDS